jgi:hypothetical protein
MYNAYVVSTCDQTYNAYKNNWKDFPYTIDWLYHTEKEFLPQPNYLYYSEEDLRRDTSFYGDVSKKHYWNSYGNRNIIWFYAHFRMMKFYLHYPNYDYYYFFDDDVSCDNWKGFVDGLTTSTSDFFSWFVFQKQDYKNHIPTIDQATTSQHMWFERFPGDNDVLPGNINEWYGSFFPVVRISNNAMADLTSLLDKGLHGWHEGFVPTMLNSMGHTLESLYQKDGTSKLYDVTKIDVKHKNQNIKWNWI